MFRVSQKRCRADQRLLKFLNQFGVSGKHQRPT